MPSTIVAAVRTEMVRAFTTPYLVPSTVFANAVLMTCAWFLLPRSWFFEVTGALAFPAVLASWMYADVPATNVLAPDPVRVLEALGDRTMLARLLSAKRLILWLFVAPFCSVVALATGVFERGVFVSFTMIIAICVVPFGVLPAASLIGIRWPYHPLRLRDRWDNRRPYGRMIVRWIVLVVAPYLVVPSLSVAVTVPALVMIIRAGEGTSRIVNFVNLFAEKVGIHVKLGTHPLSEAMFGLAVTVTCVTSALVWLVGRAATIRLIERRRVELATWLSDPAMG